MMDAGFIILLKTLFEKYRRLFLYNLAKEKNTCSFPWSKIRVNVLNAVKKAYIILWQGMKFAYVYSAVWIFSTWDSISTALHLAVYSQSNSEPNLFHCTKALKTWYGEHCEKQRLQSRSYWNYKKKKTLGCVQRGLTSHILHHKHLHYPVYVT
jgi:hypothetical protein